MKSFVFIHGKNPELSLAEIVSYLEFRDVEFEVKETAKTFTVIEARSLPKDMMEFLGGTIKIGEILHSSKRGGMDYLKGGIEEGIDFDKEFGSLPEKLVFGVSVYDSRKDFKIFSGFFKDWFKENGKSAKYVNVPNDRSGLNHIEVIMNKLIEDSVEILVCLGKKVYVGRTSAVHNPFEFQRRDMKRPVQRPIYAIPPRLCRIMINMAGKGGTLLDPYCGIGSILQEAVLMGFDVKGTDIDIKCVKGSLKNLKWLEKIYKLNIRGLRSRIRKGDSRKISSYFGRNSIDAVVTEPYLGPPLKKKPGLEKAKKIIDEVTPLYQRSLEEMLKILKPGSRIVIISPRFATNNRNISVDIKGIVEGLGGMIVDPLEGISIKHETPLVDFEKRHKTIREINVIEKMST